MFVFVSVFVSCCSIQFRAFSIMTARAIVTYMLRSFAMSISLLLFVCGRVWLCVLLYVMAFVSWHSCPPTLRPPYTAAKTFHVACPYPCAAPGSPYGVAIVDPMQGGGGDPMVPTPPRLSREAQTEEKRTSMRCWYAKLVQSSRGHPNSPPSPCEFVYLCGSGPLEPTPSPL